MPLEGFLNIRYKSIWGTNSSIQAYSLFFCIT